MKDVIMGQIRWYYTEGLWSDLAWYGGSLLPAALFAALSLYLALGAIRAIKTDSPKWWLWAAGAALCLLLTLLIGLSRILRFFDNRIPVM